jgi:hypothetical protein
MEMLTKLMCAPPGHHAELATDLSVTTTTSGPKPMLTLIDPAAA